MQARLVAATVCTSPCGRLPQPLAACGLCAPPPQHVLHRSATSNSALASLLGLSWWAGLPPWKRLPQSSGRPSKQHASEQRCEQQPACCWRPAAAAASLHQCVKLQRRGWLSWNAYLGGRDARLTTARVWQSATAASIQRMILTARFHRWACK